jgi:hypothetical protein
MEIHGKKYCYYNNYDLKNDYTCINILYVHIYNI